MRAGGEDSKVLLALGGAAAVGLVVLLASKSSQSSKASKARPAWAMWDAQGEAGAGQ